jgi:hypothetical protein
MFPELEDSKETSPTSPTASQVMMHLSVAALVGTTAPKTLCFSRHIQGHPLSILVDSGSSHTFISTLVAKTLSGVQQLHLVVSMQVANGAVLHCDSHIPATTWTVQSCSFITNLKLLGLQYHIVYHLGTLNSAADTLS